MAYPAGLSNKTNILLSLSLSLCATCEWDYSAHARSISQRKLYRMNRSNNIIAASPSCLAHAFLFLATHSEWGIIGR